VSGSSLDYLHQQQQQNIHDHPLNNNDEIDFPVLAFHSHQELSLAERSLKRLVINSQFFPRSAAEDNWFKAPPFSGASASNDDLVEDCRDDLLQRSSHNGQETTTNNSTFSTSANASKAGITAKTTTTPRTTEVTTLREDEIHVGNMIGRGGFCEVRLAHILNDKESSHNANRGYAIKYLSPTIAQRKSAKAFGRGVADLVIEARFLSLLSHNHILKLHHVSGGSLRENYNCLDVIEDDTAKDDDEFGFDRILHHDYDNRRSNSSRASCQRWGLRDVSLRHFGYFLILDLLRDTLDRRIKGTYVPETMAVTGEHPEKHHDHHRCLVMISSCDFPHHVGIGGCPQRKWFNNVIPSQWSQTHHHHHNAAFVSHHASSTQHLPLRSSLAKRLTILRGIARADKYLHEHRIVFRDIKPENIGFDERDVPKLFDFGLVKELKSSSRVTSIRCNVVGGTKHGEENDEDAVHKLTGRTGSRRYMSPEVAFSRPYNCKADSYSFGILLYEMATLVQPFAGYTIHRHEAEVLSRGERPCLVGYDRYWPDDLARLIRDCWNGDMKRRPRMDEVIRRLDGCIDELTLPSSSGHHSVSTKKEESGKTTTARSILLQLSSSPKRHPTSPIPSVGSDNNGTEEEHECNKSRTSKMRQLFASVPAALPIWSPRKANTAPQA